MFSHRVSCCDMQGEHAKKKTASAVPSNTQVKLMHRHHFSSKLQRMSVIGSVAGDVCSELLWGLV